MNTKIDIKDFALRARFEFAELQALLRISRETLGFSLRNSFDKFVAEARKLGLFDDAVIENANHLIARLDREIASAGGAPLEARSDEGDLIWLGGTDLSRQLADLERCLSRLSGNATWVCDALETEAALDRKRAQLAKASRLETSTDRSQSSGS